MDARDSARLVLWCYLILVPIWFTAASIMIAAMRYIENNPALP